MFTRHRFLLVTVKEWLKSVLNYRSYPKNKTGYPFLDHPVYYYIFALFITIELRRSCIAYGTVLGLCHRVSG